MIANGVAVVINDQIEVRIIDDVVILVSPCQELKTQNFREIEAASVPWQFDIAIRGINNHVVTACFMVLHQRKYQPERCGTTEKAECHEHRAVARLIDPKPANNGKKHNEKRPEYGDKL